MRRSESKRARRAWGLLNVVLPPWVIVPIHNNIVIVHFKTSEEGLPPVKFSPQWNVNILLT